MIHESKIQIVEAVPSSVIGKILLVNWDDVQEESGRDVMGGALASDINQPVPIQVYVEMGAHDRSGGLDQCRDVCIGDRGKTKEPEVHDTGEQNADR